MAHPNHICISLRSPAKDKPAPHGSIGLALACVHPFLHSKMFFKVKDPSGFTPGDRQPKTNPLLWEHRVASMPLLPPMVVARPSPGGEQKGAIVLSSAYKLVASACDAYDRR